MISIPYFRQTAKSNVKFLGAFTLVLCVFLIVMTNVFTPETVSGLQTAAQGTIAAHILTGNGTLIGFMSNSFYALMAIVFPMVYSIMVGNRMIAEKVDKGTMASFLSTPVTRLQITLSSALYFVLSLAVMWESPPRPGSPLPMPFSRTHWTWIPFCSSTWARFSTIWPSAVSASAPPASSTARRTLCCLEAGYRCAFLW